MTRWWRSGSAAVTAIALVGIASCGVLGPPAETDGDPWVYAGVSQASTQVAQDNLTVAASMLRFDVSSGKVKVTPENLQPVTAWLTKPAAGLGPTSPPYWQLLKASLGQGSGQYLIVSYYFGGGSQIDPTPRTWGHACGILTVTPAADPRNMTVTSKTADCPAGVPDRVSQAQVYSSTPPTTAGQRPATTG